MSRNEPTEDRREPVLPPPETYQVWMREALALAREAADADEVPVGAVVVRAGEIMATGRDRKIVLTDPTAHAEMLAVREAAVVIGDWRLEDCALFVTLEPCAMCAGAVLLARIPLLVYGASNAKFGAVETHARLLCAPQWNHSVKTVGGILADECGALLSSFFGAKRLRG